MTLVLGLRPASGVVIAADSLITEENMKAEVVKVFATPSGFIWGWAGYLAAGQMIQDEMGKLALPDRPERSQVRSAVKDAVNAVARETLPTDGSHSGLANQLRLLVGFWGADEQPYLLRAHGDGYCQWVDDRAAIGSWPKSVEFMTLAGGLADHLQFRTLSLDAVAMLAFIAMDDVIRYADLPVGRPIRLGILDQTGARVLDDAEIRSVRDAAEAFHEEQRRLLAREVPPPPGPDTGVRPAGE